MILAALRGMTRWFLVIGGQAKSGNSGRVVRFLPSITVSRTRDPINPLRFGVLILTGPPLGVGLQSIRTNFERARINPTIIARAELPTTSLDHRLPKDLQVGVMAAEEEADVLASDLWSRQHNVAFWITSDEAFFA
jgi:hypothetical protein